MRLIGISGAKGSGKDTFASMLLEYNSSSINIRTMAFADPIYDMVAVMLGRTVAELKVMKREGSALRHMLQTLGTEWGRNLIDNNVWVDVTKKRIESISSEYDYIILTDVRFENEADYIQKSHGGTLTHLERPGYSEGDEKTNSHTSESHLEALKNRADVRILNSTLSQLEDCAKFFASLFEKDK